MDDNLFALAANDRFPSILLKNGVLQRSVIVAK